MNTIAALKDLVRYRALLFHLAGVQFRTRYHNAILGVGWTLATPLALFVVFSTIFQPIFNIKQPHYGIWLLAALFPWTFLSASVGETIRSLQANATFIKANTFPREVLPLAGVLVQLLSFALAMCVVLAYWIPTNGLHPNLLLLPIPIAILTLFTAGLCLMLSSLDAVYKDVRYLVDVVMLGWFFLTPIFYPMSRIESRLGLDDQGNALLMHDIIMFNPLTPIIEAFRACLGIPSLVDGQLLVIFPDLTYPAAISILLFLFGLSQFRRLVDKYVDLL